ncbi:sensor domain-containing diguanylate cyclase [Pelagibacterium luteolum]|uniref:diguanylate cyclase n=1 Tax=Pelagibacterium luteolum TaxID=440168 RepID=A0A1G7TQW6_9HYPH|nr:sensor domain-containing diguanylate cyclase [Pelagibacterium luteolum]SDG37685.1 diguanylate cyclase (GGDEF) domain-containing protein [Pelagibacterium luteolum]
MEVDTLTDEEGRLCAMQRLGLPGMSGHAPLTRIARVAQTAMGVPHTAISLIDRKQRLHLATREIEPALVDRDSTLCNVAIQSNKPLIIEDCATDRRALDAEGNRLEPSIGAYLGVPLVTTEGYVLGCLEAMTPDATRFSEDQVTVAVNLAQLAMDYIVTLQPDNFDALTGAQTRRRFQAEVEREFQRSSRYERPAALLFLDVDGFRDFNASLGLRTADEVLKSISNRITESLRVTDCFGRLGGEEFGLLLPETLAYEASQCAERLREDIARLRFRTQAGVLSVTASFGIAPLNPEIKSAIDWFAKADIALYGAKQAGRNCVMFATTSADDQLAETAPSGRPVQAMH